MDEIKTDFIFVGRKKVTLIIEDGLPEIYLKYNKDGTPLKVRPIRGTREELLNNLDRFGDGCLGVIPDEKLIVVRNGNKLYLTPYEERII